MKVQFNSKQNNRIARFNPAFQMRKRELSALERYVFENCFPKEQRPDIQKLEGIKQFYDACKNFIVEKIIPKDFNFGGKRPETQIQRKAMMTSWFNYVTKENEAYTGAIQLMILKALTKELKPDEDKLPPVLNKGILAKTIEEVENVFSCGTNQSVDFNKAYMNNLKKKVTEDYGLSEEKTGWIVIPSKEHDPEHFEGNVEKLKTLSHPNWCTKSYNARPYLSEGDFHIYIENGKPALGVRFNGDKIQEIQGPNNNGKIPVRYSKFIKYFEQYQLSNQAADEIRDMAKVQWRILKRFPKGIENYSTEKIFKKCGIKCRKDSDGMLIISKLKSPYKDLSFWDIGINLNNLLKEVKEIEGSADFYGANSFGNVRVIKGYANIYHVDIKSLGKLEYVGDGLNYSEFDKEQVRMASELKSRMINYIHKNFFPNGVDNYSTQEILEKFGIKCKKDKDGMLIISCYKQPIKDYLYFSDLKIDEEKMLKDIKIVEDIADMYGCQAKTLGSIKEVGRSVLLYNSNIKDISSLEYAGWSINGDNFNPYGMPSEEIKKARQKTCDTFMKRHFPNGIENYSTKEILETFGIKCHKILFGKHKGKLIISHYNCPANPNLDTAKMGIDENKLFEDIVAIRGNAIFYDTNVTNTGSLEKIGKDLNMEHSKVTTIPHLKYVGGDTITSGNEHFEMSNYKNVTIKGKVK